MRVDDVYYSPEQTHLFSQSITTEQGFQIAYDDALRKYTLMNGEIPLQVLVQPCKLWTFTAENDFLLGKEALADRSIPTKMINYAIRSGVADLQSWHERLGHICPQFVKQMADHNLVECMMLRKRSFDLCDACQLGKQREKTPQKSLYRVLTRSKQASKDYSPIIGSFGKDEIAPDEDTSQNTVDSSDDEVSAFEDPDDEYHPAELMARQLLDDDAISLSTGEKNGRGDKKQKDRRSAPVEMVDPESEVDEVEELQVYVALAAITLITEPKRQPQQRTWHISEVKIPRSVSQAINSPQRAESWKGMEKEITTMIDKDVLELVPESEMPEGTKALQTTWRFQAKTDDFGNVVRYRPRLCGRGDKEKTGVDFNVVDTFSPVARMASFRIFVAMCKILHLLAYQADIDTAYSNLKASAGIRSQQFRVSSQAWMGVQSEQCTLWAAREWTRMVR
ncbi:hypothetical protein PC110_g8500 [Phytophthora cactorum]|uniref:GAG-pre-integrase domain-containing protein n=1 Tax=Phytophthora cactorum TaxID=29920 RepID=A0A329SEJ3_9STRA|nr:hypothetical protein PC110_g8500 [Phytophthora cactorum]